MNDQHPDAGYDTYATGSFATDPLFGAMPGSYDSGHSGQYDATQWQSATTAGYGTYDANATGQWDANAWNQTGQFETAAATFAYDTTSYETGAYDATAWNSAGTAPQYAEHTDYTGYYVDQNGQSGQSGYAEYQAPAPDAETVLAQVVIPEQFTPEAEFLYESEHETGYTSSYEAEYNSAYDSGYEATYDAGIEPAPEPLPEAEQQLTSDTEPEREPETGPALVVPAPRPARRADGGRSRRRTPAKRSALLTVAVPSACVMGVAGVAAASVSGLTGGEEKKAAKPVVTAADPASVKPVAANSKMDTQLAALSADARDFGDRASRTQERIDLKARQEADRKKREEEAARREALRPKFALPVDQQGLSAYYGQAGVNWMSMHTGIDFPVSYGTPVKAATDGTVRTQWNSAYGNMAIVTAADGTETWYCHLSSTKIRSGSVKAGETIAYSGNSGNSTGPHLHFEVRPGGGSAVDPLAWLRSHGLNPV
ncbi:peptidoglycan DD-metalloendopeptidase family protein [Streptomyces sp. NPDC000410]|uniref:peptidoglycan DD-metalloendopeptidase family protein n=1 Tax=Streptomyces sp. NPDC000410 TaxID=3154254 RepID=UPI0033343EB3